MCETLAVKRYTLMENIKDSMPSAMEIDFNNMLTHEKTSFLLSGLNARFTGEWSHVYINIVYFVHYMYKERYRIYETNI